MCTTSSEYLLNHNALKIGKTFTKYLHVSLHYLHLMSVENAQNLQGLLDKAIISGHIKFRILHNRHFINYGRDLLPIAF